MSRSLLPIAFSLATAAGAAAQEPWKVGEPVPELRLPTIDGKETIDLSQLRGKKLVLIEFASW